MPLKNTKSSKKMNFELFRGIFELFRGIFVFFRGKKSRVIFVFFRGNFVLFRGDFNIIQKKRKKNMLLIR